MDNDFGGGKAERIVRTSGCGLFQILIASLVFYLLEQPVVFSMMFMSFGNYNPGWRCLNSSTSTTGNYSIDHVSENHSDIQIYTKQNAENNPNKSYSIQSCDAFKKCHHVQFDPKVSTIVTEWGLTCDNYWKSSVIISVQMAGVLVGSLLSGYLGDLFGRKKVLYPFLAICGLLNILSIFSTNWIMFAAIRFLMGLTLLGIMNMYIILPSEFLTPKWRSRVLAGPAWQIGGMFFGIIAMLCEDWRYLHGITATVCLLCCLSALWVPESLRWLEINKKEKEFERVRQKILRTNNFGKQKAIKAESIENAELAISDNTKNTKEVIKSNSTSFQLFLRLFSKGYLEYTLIIGFLWLSFSVMYYGILFGTKNLYGNLYINIIIVNALNLPVSFFPMISANAFGRRATTIVLLLLTTACLMTASGFELWAGENLRNIGTLVMAMVAQSAASSAWNVSRIVVAEIYPTVARGGALGFANLMARSGGILAPFLIPDSADTLYICYLVMGGMGVICSILVFRLPETKGANLNETFEEN